MMGGADKMVAKGKALHEVGKYRLAQEIVNRLVFAEPDNQQANDLLADVWEQIGYQQENPGLRNSFLAAAHELRSGVPQGFAVDTSSPDVARGMSSELFLDFLGVRHKKAEEAGLEFGINLINPDVGKKFAIELSNATLTNVEGLLLPDPDLTVTIDRADLETVLIGEKTLAAQIADGKAKVDGDPKILEQLASVMIEFPTGFEILPSTIRDVAPDAPATENYAEKERFGKIRRWLEERRSNSYQHQGLAVSGE